MPGCHFCQKATEMFKNEIHTGKIVVKKHTESGNRFRGFPSFENIKNGKTMSGLPQTKIYLFQTLEYDQSKDLLNHHKNEHKYKSKDEHKLSTNHIIFFGLGLLLLFFIILLVTK